MAEAQITLQTRQLGPVLSAPIPTIFILEYSMNATGRGCQKEMLRETLNYHDRFSGQDDYDPNIFGQPPWIRINPEDPLRKLRSPLTCLSRIGDQETRDDVQHICFKGDQGLEGISNHMEEHPLV